MLFGALDAPARQMHLCRMARILIAGATGLVGSTALRLALEDPRVDEAVALVRRPLELHDAHLVEWLAPSANLLDGLRNEHVDAVLCCLGTTIRNVGGDRQKFIHVDKDLVVGLAKWAQAQGVPVFAVVSAIGADAASAVFYSRVKGEMEQELKAIGLPTLHILQPSILTGPRTEKRFGERIGIAAMTLLKPLLPGRYKPMPSAVLAQALLSCVHRRRGGTHAGRAIWDLAALRT
jgi:uncharacterized protein YbjT (DUF2867 family)